ncbi:dihydroneopterin aldolase [Inquilinus sp. NPDC058860]|uniref:dihydroneopterin aldolase n=1 Tax=Inquilinus sp. NPDC058860 TaxID=3346652 RepID=UPI0036893EAC
MSAPNRSPIPLVTRAGSKPTTFPTAETARAAAYLIRLRHFVVPMSIGVYAHEEERRQRVRISVEMEVELPAGGIGDDIGRIPSYEGLVQGLRALAEKEHVRLIETVAEHVLDLAMAHPMVLRATTEVEKLDVFPEAEAIGVRFERRREG